MKTRWVLLAVGAACSVSCGQVIQNPQNGHYYKVVVAPYPPGICWSTANSNANIANGYLATITSSSENAFVVNAIQETDGATFVRQFQDDVIGPFIGGYQPSGSFEPNGGWRWTTNEIFNYNMWYPGQPDDGAGGNSEDSIHYWQPSFQGETLLGWWNDLAQCDMEGNTGYVIEWDSNPCATISQQPQPVHARLGETVHFSVAVSGAGTYYYQWKQGTRFLNNGLGLGGNISGATTATLTISNLSSTAAGFGGYSCFVTDQCGGVTSAAADLALYSTNPNGTWNAVGLGTNGRVSSLGRYNTDLVAGGQFSRMMFATVNGIALLDGYDWHGLGTGVSIGAGLDAGVNSIAQLGPNLYAMGEFATAGGVTANHVACWNGGQWLALHTPFATGVYGSPIRASRVINDQLHIGGTFSFMQSSSEQDYLVGSGDPTMTQQINWSWGSITSQLFDVDVRAIEQFNGQMVAGGTYRGGGTSTDNIRRFNGSSWATLGTGMNGSVRALAVYNGLLYAGGSFTTAGGVSASNIAVWNGSNWAAMGAGANNWVRSLAVLNGQLIVGGDFTTAGGVSANRIARWDPVHLWRALGTGTSGPVYALQPIGTVLAVGGEFVTAGGVTVNNFAVWTPPEPCLADFNRDQALDFFDYLDFVDAFSRGSASADFNADGIIDFFDYLDFVDAFSVGC